MIESIKQIAVPLKQTDLKRISDYIFEVPMSYRNDMRVPARVFMHESMMQSILEDRALWQLVNVATLPGIVNYAYAMPDIHQGYGFPIGGVAAIDLTEGGIVSPGGIGYDINCGVRLLASELLFDEVKPYLEQLATKLFHAIPSGVGRGGVLQLNNEQLEEIFLHGAPRLVHLGFGNADDLTFCEEGGFLAGANAAFVSSHAKKRSADQLGTLGSGNHFLELQVVEEIFDRNAAEAFGLSENIVTIMIHCGSRGFGHQICTDYVKIMMEKAQEWSLTLPDRELIYAPFHSQEGQQYMASMAAAANYAWANRHMIGHAAREVWQKIFGLSAPLKTVYDLSHNIGKIEEHLVNGTTKQLLMHRKGATRSFGPGNIHIPQAYQSVGQPVLIPGTMGTASYVMAGTSEGMNVAFGSSCHGAGRALSRTQALKQLNGAQIFKDMQAQGVTIRTGSRRGLAEEAPVVYKDIHKVIDVVHGAKLAKKVAKLKPIGVIKG